MLDRQSVSCNQYDSHFYTLDGCVSVTNVLLMCVALLASNIVSRNVITTKTVMKVSNITGAQHEAHKTNNQNNSFTLPLFSGDFLSGLVSRVVSG